MNYSLKIEIDSDGLNTLNQSNQKIAIVQRFASPPQNPVLWVVVPPTRSVSILWSDVIFVYSSTDPIVLDGFINISGDPLQATAGSIYQFKGGQLSQAQGSVQPDEFEIRNEDSDFSVLTAGLARQVRALALSVNPLNAAGIPFNEMGIFSLREELGVFAASEIESGQVVSPSLVDPSGVPSRESARSVATQVLDVDFSTPSQTIHYDDANNVFVPGPLPSG